MTFISPSAVTVKRGETFNLAWTLTDEAGNPVDVTGATATSAIASADGTFVAPITATISPPNQVALTSNTTAWPIGTFDCDVRILLAGTVFLTDTTVVTVEKPVTTQ